ncbi:MAG: hypothetical protein JW765_03960 [Deltaproteobacteria bacterium]|nr:hypothetical protein [Candidatus Zymogenaceae bacterium]
MKKYLLTFFVFALLLGCAPSYYKLYTTPPVTPGEHATIMTKYDKKTVIVDINGVKVSGKREVTVDVPPGVVRITPMYNSTRIVSGELTTLVFPVTSGHTYILGCSQAEMTDEGKDVGGGGSYEMRTIYFYLLDRDTGERVYSVDCIDPFPVKTD